MDTRHIQPIVNFSLRKEVFFVAVGSIVGAFTMHLPIIFSDLFGSSSYQIWLLTAARIVNSSQPEIGLALHFFVATIIGIVTGIFLHKVLRFNISRIPKGLTYGVISGTVVFVVFAIPVSQIFLGPNTIEILSEINPEVSPLQITQEVKENFQNQMINSLFMHLVWGVTLGIISSVLTRKIGANYLCHVCNVEFSNIKTYEHHTKNVHENPSPKMKKILILGGGYAGVGVLNKIQKSFENNVDVSIELVSESNFFLHTPMLPEMATGTIEPRHIATPIRRFCKRAQFHQSKVVDIQLDSKQVTIQRMTDKSQRVLSYDYLVLAMGGKTNFFGNINIEKNSLTIKSLDDAIKIRNHIISMLEDADQETNLDLQKKIMTFVVVGGGFSGVETVGEINDFVRESAKKFYRNIHQDNIKIILVAAGDKILPEIGNLGEYSRQALEKDGVTIYTNTKLEDISNEIAILTNKKEISTATVIWAGGNTVESVIEKINTKHHKSGRVIVNRQLKLEDHLEVFALGDCAFSTDPRSGNPYPPTAQHAIRQAKTVAENLENKINGVGIQNDFIYDTKGSMAKIGKKDGVALVLGHEFRGFIAWLIWKQYYLSTLPTNEKKIRVGLDWFIDLFFPRDITRLSSIFDEKK
ncbi:NAD(P)/FAD-dependent oxidoreductase [Nitrosopumilus ureiphilus]|uniref:NADH:ubiquinone reductase (non-electrogenic) n=1 Tax=Nitrosopumilus ureiphilus TaxID=1470067 RepID=A0A7D5M8X3_9ARCH|nr:NAD(P)/FAD-dependent oxidoreductase [Nitrosopumilus ureiphilus]QLH07470.1 6-phosphogluconate dehydrogenase [Nitrosopumilus ureiphilus]